MNETPNWRKSSFSACNGNCWEAARVASSCNNGSCLEASLCDCSDRDEVWVRDSKLGVASPILKVTTAQWWSFLAAVKTGMVHTYSGALQVTGRDGGWLVCHRDDPETVLRFDPGEVVAFEAGVVANEFSVAALASSRSQERPGEPLSVA